MRRRRRTPPSRLISVPLVLLVAGFLLSAAPSNTGGAILVIGVLVGLSWLLRKVWRARKARLRTHTLGELLMLTPSGFEQEMAALLQRIGYHQVRRVGGAGDLGADLLARDRQGRSVVVQCKRYAPGRNVGSPELQSFIGMMTVHHRADRGMYITTSGYTAPAVALAAGKPLELLDGRRLCDLLNQARGNAPASAKE